MGALTKGAVRRQRVGGYSASYVAMAVIFQGAMVVLDATTGQAKAAQAGAAGTNGRVVGVAQHSAAVGELVRVERWAYQFKSTAAAPVTWADVGKPCFAANDNEVTMDDAGGVRAGTVVDVELDGTDVLVWVDFSY